MEPAGSRRDLLRLGAAGLAGALAGCSRVADLYPESPAVDADRRGSGEEIIGRVDGVGGGPLPGATVEAVGHENEVLAETTTGEDGRFRLAIGRPVWLRTGADEYHAQVRAGDPRGENRVVLSPDDAAVLRFGGDVMFGRRFYEPSTDHRIPRFSIGSGDLAADHRHVLSSVEPLLRSADLTSINLETPLTTSRLRHPTKLYAYSSHPVAAPALADAGVDYAALGNNHAFDALEPGLVDTREHLADAGIAFSGAGLSAGEAWEPALVEASGLTVALLSATTIAGQQYDLDWSADRGTGSVRTVESNGSTVSFPDDVGVAEATEARLSARVGAATERADVVVVQLHGGEPYRRVPTDRMRSLTETAAAAGADLVVNHHSHVVGGIERLGSTVVAWSLGNFVFDQKLWVTFPTYLLAAHVTAEGVTRVDVDPLLIDRFVPKGVVGEPNRWVTSTTAGHSDRTLGITGEGLSGRKRDTAAWRAERRTFEGGGIYARERGWVAELESGDAALGRGLFPTGGFEDALVAGDQPEVPLWRFDRERAGSGQSFGHSGRGMRLKRVDRNGSPLVLSNSRRVPVAGALTMTGLFRSTASEGAELLVNWYPNTSSSAVETDSWALPHTDGEWQRTTRELEPPQIATHVNVVFRLAPPASGTHRLDVDDVRLIEWAGPEVDGGREYDHLRATGEVTAQLRVSDHLARGSSWTRLPLQ